MGSTFVPFWYILWNYCSLACLSGMILKRKIQRISSYQSIFMNGGYFYENSYSPFLALSERNSIFLGKPLVRVTFYRQLKKLADEINESLSNSWQVVDELLETMIRKPVFMPQGPAKFINRGGCQSLAKKPSG